MAAAILLVFILIHFVMRWPTEAQERIGCFKFIHAKTVLSVKTPDAVKSIAACIQQCQSLSYTYAGVRYGYNCYCGDSHNHAVNEEQLSDSRCTTSCIDQARRCGGQDSIVIYSVCNRRHYHDNTTADYNCNASCYCKDNHICLYKTGSCPANCETGWSGEACNIRVGQPKTEAATRIPETDNEVTVTVPSVKDGISVTAVAVGISSAVLALIIIIALIVFLRRRRNPHNSGGQYEREMTIQEADTDVSKQTENGSTINTSIEPPAPCYSSVEHLNNGPAHIDGEDIPKSDDVNGELEMAEYAVVKTPGDEMHLNLMENTLYGTNDEDSGKEGQE